MLFYEHIRFSNAFACRFTIDVRLWRYTKAIESFRMLLTTDNTKGAINRHGYCNTFSEVFTTYFRHKVSCC